MRTKAPRADRLDKIRDIAIILYRNGGNMAKLELKRQIEKNVTPPQLNSWTMSNIKEYVAALPFLGLVSSPKQGKLHLTDTGKLLAEKGNFGIPKLNGVEREILRNVILRNSRFEIFLTLFTGGRIPRDRTEFVAFGRTTELRYSSLRTQLDSREAQGIFKNWALNTEIIEWNSTTNEYFPVLEKERPLELMYESLVEAYRKVEDRAIGRAEIYKIKDIICQKYSIPSRQFYESLLEINKRYSDKVRLEVVPITMLPIQNFKIESAERFGIVTSKGIYYYLKILNIGG